MEKLAPGDAFPPIVVAAPGGLVALEERWQESPLVVAFMRHFG